MKVSLRQASLTLLVLGTLCLPSVLCYPNGAGPQACASESPQVCHKGSPQTSPSPFSIVVQATTYSPGVTLNVTLKTNNDSQIFEGFLVGAHSVQGDKTEYLGSFIASNLSKTVCGEGGNTGVTHTGKDAKKTVLLQWTPPGTAEGELVITGAVLQDFSTYWVNVTSSSLQPADYPPPSNETTSAAPTTAPTPSAMFPKGSGCGETKSCYGDCNEQDQCTLLVTWHVVDQSSLNISFKSVETGTNAWVALGFGTSDKMNPASVTECVVNNGGVKAFTSFNNNYDNSRVKPNDTEGLSQAEGGLVDGVLTCTVLRQLTPAGAGPDVYNLTRPFYVMLARGPASGWDKQPHDGKNAFVTESTYDVTTNVDIGAHAKSYPLVKLHGALMTLAWVLSGSIGVLVARFYKPAWPTQSLCGVKVWFAVHRATMVSAFVATVAGFVIIFVHVKGLSQINGPTYHKAHPIMGIVVTALTVLNPIMSLFRCAPDHEHRPLFNWAHFLVGTSAYIVGVVAVAIGTRLEASQTPDYVIYYVAGFGGWHVLAHLALEIIKYMESNDAMVGVYKDLQSFSSSYDGMKYRSIRQAIFAAHVVCALSISVAILVDIIGV